MSCRWVCVRLGAIYLCAQRFSLSPSLSACPLVHWRLTSNLYRRNLVIVLWEFVECDCLRVLHNKIIFERSRNMYRSIESTIQHISVLWINWWRVANVWWYRLRSTGGRDTLRVCNFDKTSSCDEGKHDALQISISGRNLTQLIPTWKRTKLCTICCKHRVYAFHSCIMIVCALGRLSCSAGNGGTWAWYTRHFNQTTYYIWLTFPPYATNQFNHFVRWYGLASITRFDWAHNFVECVVLFVRMYQLANDTCSVCPRPRIRLIANTYPYHIDRVWIAMNISCFRYNENGFFHSE